jgi:hypothetical protein
MIVLSFRSVFSLNRSSYFRSKKEILPAARLLAKRDDEPHPHGWSATPSRRRLYQPGVWFHSGSYPPVQQIKNALVFSEHDDVRINGEPDDSLGVAIPANAVNNLDEVAKHQCLLFVIGFHAMTIR